MSAIYAKTPNRGLNLYGDQDPADFRDGHNANMRIIDTDLQQLITASQDSYTKQEIDGAFALKADKSDTYTKSETDQHITTAIQQGINDHLVWIGDSWSDAGADTSVQGLIPRMVAEALHMQLHNFAVGGSGILSGGQNNFLNQAIRAHNDTSFDDEHVGLVVIFGGINDRRSQPDKSAISNLYLTCLQYFTNARVVCIPMQKASNGNDWAFTRSWISAYLDTGVGKVSVISGAWYWAAGLADHFNYTDPGHPNASGCALFASRILTALTGGQPTGVPLRLNCDMHDGTTSVSHLAVDITGDGYFRVHGAIVSSSTSTEYIVASVPDEFRTYTGAGYSLMVPILAQQGGDGIKTYLNFVDDPTRPTPAGYVGAPLAIQMSEIVQAESYYIDSTLPILME